MITASLEADRSHQLSLQETLQLGEAMFKSGLFPDIRNAAAAVVKILAGREMGFGPFASMANVHVIEGKPSIGAHLLAAAIRRSERYDYDVVARNREVCELAFWERTLASGGETRKGVGGWVKKAQNIALTMKDAIDSGLAVAKDGKLKANWSRTPDDMLFARVISKGYRTYCPDLSSGVLAYDPDELEALPQPQPIQEPTPRLPESAPVNGTGHVEQPAQSATLNTIQMARLDELCVELKLKPGTFQSKVRAEFGHTDVSQLTPQQADVMIERMTKALGLARAKSKEVASANT